MPRLTGRFVLAAGLGLAVLASGLAADTPPGQAALSAQLTGYGSVFLTATAAQGSAALSYISVTAQVGADTSWLANLAPGVGASAVLPACGSVTLSAEAVDMNGETGPLSAPADEVTLCGPAITSFSPNPSTPTGEVLDWDAVPGAVSYVLAASPGPNTAAADPLPSVLTATSTSCTYLFTTGAGGTAYENLFYRVYAVDQNGVTSTACCADSAYSFAIPPIQSYSVPAGVALTVSPQAFVPVGPALPLTYTFYGSTATSSGFVALASVAVAAEDVTAPLSLTLTNQGADEYYYFSVSDGAEVGSSLTPPASALLFAPPLATPALSGSSDVLGVTLSWFPVADATGYNVYRTDLTPTAITGENGAPVYDSGTGLWSYTDASSYLSTGGAPSNAGLDYAVQAYTSLSSTILTVDSGTGLDQSALSPPISVPNPIAAAPPAALTALATGAGGGVALAWSASTAFNNASNGPVSTYVVYYSTQSANPQGQGVTSTAVSASITALTITKFPSGAPLQDGVLTWFWVAAYNGVGLGPFSPAASAIPYTPPLGPTLTAGVLSFGQGVSLSVAVTGSPDVALGSVNIFSSANSLTPVASLDPAALAEDPSALSTTLSASLFPCGVPLTLTARAVDIQGDTGSAGTGVWLEPPCAPSASASGLNAGSLTLAWSQPAGGDGDSYVVASAIGPGWALGRQTQLTLTSALSFAAPASPGQSLWYSVYALDRSDVTSPASAQVGLLQPPSGLETLPGAGQVYLSWVAPPAADSTGLDGYRVYYSDAAGFTSGASVFGVSPGAASLTVSSQAVGVTVGGLANFTPYAFAVASAADPDFSVLGSASSMVSDTTGLSGPALNLVGTSPPLGASVVFGPLTVTATGGSYLPATWTPTSNLFAQWSLGSYTPVPSSVFTLYEATDPTSTPQTFTTITPVASAPYSALGVSIPAGAPGPAWYFLNVSDASGANLDGGNTADARTAASAYFAPNLQPVPLTLAAPVSNGRVQLSWAAVPFANSYLVYRATQDEPAVGATTGLAYSALSTSATPSVFTQVGAVSSDLDGDQGFSFTDTAPVENARNAYEVVAGLTQTGGVGLYGVASNAVTVTPHIRPQDPGYWSWPGGNDGVLGAATTGGNTGGVSGYYVTAAATADPAGGVFLEWSPSGEGSNPLSYYSVYRGYSPAGMTLLGTVFANVTSTTAATPLPSYTDTSPPQPLAGLLYGVSATDSRGYSSPDIVTTTVQAPTLWPAPALLANPGLAGLCPEGYCSGSKSVTLTWAPGVSITAVTPPSGSVAYVTLSAGTFPFQAWQVSRIAAPGAAPSILAGFGAPGGADVTVTAGSLSALTQTTFTDNSPVAGGPAYVIAAVDSQGNVGTPLSVSVTVPLSSFRALPLTVTGLSAVPVVVQLAPGDAVLGASLTWSPNAPQDNVAGYFVDRGSYTVTETASASFVDSAGLSDSAGAVVAYTVQAVNAVNLPGPFSQPYAFTLAPPAPSSISLTADIPPGVAASPAVGLRWQDALDLQGGAFAVTWSAGSYTVFRSDNPNTPLPGCSGISLSAECADTAPIASASYDVESAVFAGGVTVVSASLSPSLPVSFSATAPPPPAALTATAGAAGVALSWTAAASPGATEEYWVYRSNAPLGASPTYSDYLARVTGTAFLDAGVFATQALTYSTQVEPYYAVAAASPWAVGSALDAAVPPTPPAALSAFAGGAGLAPDVSATVSLLWQASTSGAVTGYNVWRSQSPGGDVYLGAVSLTAYTDYLTASAGLTDTVLSYTVMSEAAGQSGPCSMPATVTAYDLPRAPFGLSGSGLQNGVDATWKPDYASQGVTGYAVSWNVSDGSGGGLSQVAGSSDWSLNGLVSGQSVTLSVQALNSAGGSLWAGPITLTASAVGPPAAPVWMSIASGLSPSAAAVSGCAIVLSVSDTVQGALVVYRSPAPGTALPASPGDWAPLRLSDCAGGPASPYYLTTLPQSLYSLTDTSVSALYPYSYAVTALGPLGLPGDESVPLASSPLTLTAYNAWAPPVLNGLAGNSLVSLWWSPPSQAGAGSYKLSGYLLYRQTGGAGTPPVPDSGFPIFLSQTQTAYTDHQVLNAQPGATGGYGYWMACLDQAGNQSLSASTGTLTPVGALAPPTNITALPGDDSVILQWIVPQSDVVSGASYNVYRRRLSGPYSGYGPPLPNLFHIQATLSGFPTAVSLQTEAVEDPPGTPSSPVDLTPVCYAITAVDAAGEGPKSPDICVTPYKPLNPVNWGVSDGPNPVVTIVDNNGDRSSVITVAISFDEIPAAGYSLLGGYTVSGYVISRSQNDGASYTTLAYLTETAGATTASVLSYLDTKAQEGQSYIYQIQPVDGGGNLGAPYDLKTVQIPAGQNSLYVYRNSFDPMTGGSVNVQVGLQQSGNFWIKVYTLNGEYVATIVSPTYSFGTSNAPYLSTVYNWNGTNSRGQIVASGVYLIHLQGPGYNADARVAVIK